MKLLLFAALIHTRLFSQELEAEMARMKEETKAALQADAEKLRWMEQVWKYPGIGYETCGGSLWGCRAFI